MKIMYHSSYADKEVDHTQIDLETAKQELGEFLKRHDEEYLGNFGGPMIEFWVNDTGHIGFLWDEYAMIIDDGITFEFALTARDAIPVLEAFVRGENTIAILSRCSDSFKPIAGFREEATAKQHRGVSFRYYLINRRDECLSYMTIDSMSGTRERFEGPFMDHDLRIVSKVRYLRSGSVAESLKSWGQIELDRKSAFHSWLRFFGFE